MQDILRLPKINRESNPEVEPPTKLTINTYYISKVHKAYKNHENTYMMNLARQHFLQTIEAIRIGKKIKPNAPAKEIKLAKRNPKFKTIFLDLDETLVHCDENDSHHCTARLNFPIEGGGTIAVKYLLHRQALE